MTKADAEIPTDQVVLPVEIANISLGREVLRIEIAEWQGRPLISAWRFYRTASGDLKPSKRGLACDLERLPAIAKAFETALERARSIGLLPQATDGDGQ